MADPVPLPDFSKMGPTNRNTGPNGAIPVSPSSYPYTPLGYEQITNLTAAVGLNIPTGATVAFISVENAAVRYRDDGVAPTSAVGMPVGAGGQLVYSGPLGAIEFIQQAAGAVLDINYYK